MVNRTCTQRQFLLRPDEETNNAFIYCLAVASQRHNVTVMNFVQMSNHLHLDIFDEHANAPAFYGYFHRLLAKCVNALRGRWENFFASEEPCVVRLESVEDVLERLVYVAVNPVAANLVERVDDWPGASGYRALLSGKPLRATRPKHFFSANGRMPKEVELTLSIPEKVGDKAQILSMLQARVEAFEQERALERARTGSRVVGRKRILRQHWSHSPDTHPPKGNLRPRIAARSSWRRVEAIQRNREFIEAHANARAAMIDGKPIPFPYGTYWLRKYMQVAVEAPSQTIRTRSKSLDATWPGRVVAAWFDPSTSRCGSTHQPHSVRRVGSAPLWRPTPQPRRGVLSVWPRDSFAREGLGRVEIDWSEVGVRGVVIRNDVLADSLIDILVCPRSKQALIYFPRGEANSDESAAMLVCPSARLKYRIEEGVPILLVDEAEELSPDQTRSLVTRAKELGLRIPAEL